MKLNGLGFTHKAATLMGLAFKGGASTLNNFLEVNSAYFIQDRSYCLDKELLLNREGSSISLHEVKTHGSLIHVIENYCEASFSFLHTWPVSLNDEGCLHSNSTFQYGTWEWSKIAEDYGPIANSLGNAINVMLSGARCSFVVMHAVLLEGPWSFIYFYTFPFGWNHILITLDVILV